MAEREGIRQTSGDGWKKEEQLSGDFLEPSMVQVPH